MLGKALTTQKSMLFYLLFTIIHVTIKDMLAYNYTVIADSKHIALLHTSHKM